MNKYQRKIKEIAGKREIIVDVYSVLEAFDVTCPARQHAIKKLLMAGQRGSKDALTDLKETVSALARAHDLEEQREADKVENGNLAAT